MSETAFPRMSEAALLQTAEAALLIAAEAVLLLSAPHFLNAHVQVEVCKLDSAFVESVEAALLQIADGGSRTSAHTWRCRDGAAVV
jgi:hypothetical protein